MLAYRGDAAPGGWQRQAHPGLQTVQGALEAALAQLHGNEPSSVYGASRTDAGVHARMQLAAADVRDDMSPRQVAAALNKALPPGIRVLWAALAPPQFHPRHDVGAKTYTYRFAFGPVCHPFAAPTHWWVPGRLDLAPLAELAATWRGRHDFAAACSSRADVGEQGTVRTLEISRFDLDSDGLTGTYTCSSRGFLMHQVRILAGTLIRVAQGHATPAQIAAALARGDRSGLGVTAPAHGLTLEHVAIPELAWGEPWPQATPPGLGTGT